MAKQGRNKAARTSDEPARAKPLGPLPTPAPPSSEAPAPATSSAAAARGPVIDMSAFEDDDDENEEARFERLGDVLIVDPVRIQRLKAKGSDARVSRIRVYKWVNG